jgi:hypothetical protein
VALATETELRKKRDEKHGTRKTEKAKGPKTRDETKTKKTGETNPTPPKERN